ncbi:alanine--tRNA ligase [Panacibacter ginsenosidivorans]|uniref:Alanine--tRNA ligase n=1 Tax=Panacibacter ginsenosidivorans TaxID=1813871 RepID=A0A5B8VAB0_9BACT|nr:alanine--tRNA ligase [Panacibacter ginsenosidivorans]QEC67636.1 alanine--tRNA ligase [Panacibacter ginsenosidivorans]
MLTSAEIRKQFLDFFQSKGHHIVPSAPIVVKNDPTLLFTNAGMNQFKDYFLGNKKAPYTRVADTQKCLRVSGKHNDLEEVGVDTYHHTMFEMLGNWSFGDYFKAEAIAWSWELLTEVYKLDKDRLYVTIFEGDVKENLPKDEEAYNEWKKVIAEDRILLGNKKDNFWEMGDTGPCGPCTEIHVDCRTDEERKAVDGKTLVNNDHPQVIEIWNNVFIQFNRLKDGSLEPLPAKHVDTGMGFERLVRVIQNNTSNYDTDVFTGTIAATENIVGKKYNATAINSPSTGGSWREAVAFRVIADHIRAISFTIADGQLPSNTGAGYVIRRILRRAVRYYYSYLDYKQPLLHQLLPVIAKQFANVFPELEQQLDFVSKVVKEEEDAFLKTLGKGITKFNSYINFREQFPEATHAYNEELGDEFPYDIQEGKKVIVNPQSLEVTQKTIPGKFAFELTDTYGFPIDLTELMAKEIGWKVDVKEFEKELAKQKSRSRAATAIDTEDWIVLDEYALNEFVGYDSMEIQTKVTKYRKVKAKGKEAFQIVLEATPFYAESGGQVGDTGKLLLNNEEIIITDTKKENNLIIHFADSIPADLNGEVFAKVDVTKRKATEVHHSATHLLHAALRKVLGTHVAQKGSLVNNEHLRFDFSHFAKVTDEEIAQIEILVNEKIRTNIPVVIKQMHKDEAIAMGAMALFGEKYGDTVRVVIIDPHYSIELCGGTHVCNTGELGFFKIKHESAVAAGVRRIEAVSGKAAEELIAEQFETLGVIRETLKNPKEIQKSVENLVTENNELKKKVESLEAKQLAAIKSELVDKAQIINGFNFIGEVLEVSNADALKKLSFDLKTSLNNYIVVLAANIEGKASVAVSMDDNFIAAKNTDAPKIIKEHIAPLIKGGGGGQKTLATAGGQDTSNLQQVIEKVKALL